MSPTNEDAAPGKGGIHKITSNAVAGEHHDTTEVQPGCCASCPRSFVTNCSDGCVLALPTVTT